MYVCLQYGCGPCVCVRHNKVCLLWLAWASTNACRVCGCSTVEADDSDIVALLYVSFFNFPPKTDGIPRARSFQSNNNNDEVSVAVTRYRYMHNTQMRKWDPLSPPGKSNVSPQKVWAIKGRGFAAPPRFSWLYHIGIILMSSSGQKLVRVAA